MSNSILISQLPAGVINSISGLRALDVSTCIEGVQVSVNGALFLNDGGQGTFTFNAANSTTDDGRMTIGTPTTGRWVLIDPIYSGLAVPASASLSGVAESFILLSGAGSSLLIYTFPPSYNAIPDQIVLKQLGTGQVRLQATGNDLLFDTNSASYAASITFQSSGATYTFQPVYNATTTSGVYYRI